MSTATKTEKKPKKPTGKEQGLSLRRCLATSKVYSRDMEGPLPYLYFIPLSLAWFVCDFVLRYHYRAVGVVGVKYLPANLFTLGWIFIMVGLVFALPGKWKWPFRCITLMFCMANMETHSGFYNFFGKFFTLSSLQYVGDGQFASREYIHIDGFIIAGAIATIILMMCSGRMLTVMPPRTHVWTVLAGVAAMVIGICLVADTQSHYFPREDTVVWEVENATDPAVQNAEIYNSFTDTTNCVMLSGLYQYTARDIWHLIRPASLMSPLDRERVDQYIREYEDAKTDNAFTGLLAGKNVILVQLEAVDTWLIDPDYMPTLARLKDEGLAFVNHYTPSFIPAGTFNTEFMVNTSIIPATGGIPTSVYQENDFPYSLANLFRNAGYTAEVFHGSEPDVYERGAIHNNLGYQAYHSGTDMAMDYYQMDRYLINGFDDMTAGDPFFSFVITYSVHGPYGDNAIWQAHKEQAEAADKVRRGNTSFAIAGAMETDLFVAELMEQLEASGHLEDTVLIFYPDHMNFYLQDDELEMELRGVDSANLLLHTDFFLWSADLPAMEVEKVTSSLDILPTLANLFALDTEGAFLIGHDGLGDQGGYVFFADGSWYDGQTYWDSGSGAPGDPARTAEINRLRSLSNKVLAGNYYGSGFEEWLE